MKLAKALHGEEHVAMSIIEYAKEKLREQNIDQWQNGYPDLECIKTDIRDGKGYFVMYDGEPAGYACVDFDGEPAYDDLEGAWHTPEKYVVVHRLAFSDKLFGKGLCDAVFRLIENMSREKGVYAFRIDTDSDNMRMRHILEKNGFGFCGTIWFDNSEKIAFDRIIDENCSTQADVL